MAITVKNGAVVQATSTIIPQCWDARSARIETHVINSGHDIGGSRRAAPALANAVFDATGLRIRQLPLGNFDLNYQSEEEVSWADFVSPEFHNRSAGFRCEVQVNGVVKAALVCNSGS